MKRPVKLVIASLLEAVSGLLGIIFGAILVIAGGLVGGFIEEIGLGFIEQLMALGVYVLGIIIIIWGVIELVAAYGLWTLRKWAGYLTIVLCILSIIISAAMFSPFSIIDFIWDGIIIILVLLGWKRLKSTRRRRRKAVEET